MIAAVSRRGMGQGLTEYPLVLALVAVVALVAVLFLGVQISRILLSIAAAF